MQIVPGSIGEASTTAPELSPIRVDVRFLGRKVESTTSAPTRYQRANLVEYRFGDARVVTQEPWRYMLDGRIPTASYSDKALVVNAGEDGRPDRVAKRAYGLDSEHAWWFLMVANGLSDFEELRPGMTLLAPTQPFSTDSPELERPSVR